MGLKTNITHRNYAWESDSNPNSPGWNFLNFESQHFRDLKIWFMTYDPMPKKTKNPRRSFDMSLSGLVVNERCWEFLTKIFGTVSQAVLGDQKIICKPGFRSLNAVIVECENFEEISLREELLFERPVRSSEIDSHGILCLFLGHLVDFFQ